MSGQHDKYMVSVSEHADRKGILVFTFVPSTKQASGVAPNRVPQFIVWVREQGDNLQFDWGHSPDAPDAAKSEIENEISVRMQARAKWMNRVRQLVQEVSQWAANLGWSTRQLEKSLDDAGVGTHRIPALLMQAETVRVLLEPIGRSSPTTEGIVDLYLMPGYDDIASIYYYNDRWNLHYVFDDGDLASVEEIEGSPLSQESLERVLTEMRQHAA